MKEIGGTKYYDFDEVLDEIYGKPGTEARDEFDRQTEEAVRAWHIGEAIRQSRQAQNLTQEQLGEKIGVKRSQISKLEKGKCVITLPTMSRVFKALGFPSATLDLGNGEKLALW